MNDFRWVLTEKNTKKLVQHKNMLNTCKRQAENALEALKEALASPPCTMQAPPSQKQITKVFLLVNNIKEKIHKKITQVSMTPKNSVSA